MSIFGWLFGRVKAFAVALKNLFTSDAVRDLLNTTVGQITQAVVSELSKADFASLTDDEKRKEAFRRIVTQAKEAGVELRDSVVGLLIEICVNKLKM